MCGHVCVPIWQVATFVILSGCVVAQVCWLLTASTAWRTLMFRSAPTRRWRSSGRRGWATRTSSPSGAYTLGLPQPPLLTEPTVNCPLQRHGLPPWTHPKLRRARHKVHRELLTMNCPFAASTTICSAPHAQTCLGAGTCLLTHGVMPPLGLLLVTWHKMRYEKLVALASDAIIFSCAS